jgi:hypothetical protein
MVDVGQSELLVRLNAPSGMRLNGEGAYVPVAECVQATAK